MNGLARFLIRLYPANWRARYGEEFEALLEDSRPAWPAVFDLLKGAIKMQLSVPAFPKLALVLSATGLLTGLVLSFAVTPRYVSQAEMQLDARAENATPLDSRRNLTEYIMQLENEILSRTSLSTIIQDPRLDLYKTERASRPLEDVIEEMRKKDIQIRIDAPGGASRDYLPLHITFAYRDPVLTRQTVQVLLTKFQDSNLNRQRVPAYVKRHRSYDQIDRMEARIATLEKRLGIPPAAPEPEEQFSVASSGINIDVLDPPTLPAKPVYPDRLRFTSYGGGVGLAASVAIAIFRRRPPAVPFPAQTA